MDSHPHRHANPTVTRREHALPLYPGLWAVVALFGLSACQIPPPTAILPATADSARAAAAESTLPPPLPPSARTPTITPSPSETSAPTHTHTPTVTFTPSPTATRTPVVPRAQPEELPLPRPDVTIEEHLLFGRPMPEGGNNYPVSNYRYGMTWDGLLAPHRGVDLANDEGTPVVAIGPGTVHYAGDDSTQRFAFIKEFYGNLVIVQLDQRWHERPLFALYAHLSAIEVESGQAVAAGEPLGAVGQSGAALAPHLHLEIRIDDPANYMMVRNPELWYSPLPGAGVLAGRVLDRQGRFVPGQLVEIICPDGGRRWVETYWNQRTLPDEVMSENFVFGDIPEMECTAQAEMPGVTLRQPAQIRAGHIAFVLLQLPAN